MNFEFRQCGTYTIKDGKQYKIQTKDLTKQAKLANFNYKRLYYKIQMQLKVDIKNNYINIYLMYERSKSNEGW